eukprot:TCONS_00049199-protein
MNKKDKKRRRRSSSSKKSSSATARSSEDDLLHEAAAMQASEDDDELNYQYVLNEIGSNPASSEASENSDDEEVRGAEVKERSELDEMSKNLKMMLNVTPSRGGSVYGVERRGDGIKQFDNDHTEIVQSVKATLGSLKNSEKQGQRVTLKKAALDSTLKKKAGELDVNELQQDNRILVEENKKLKKERDSMKNKLQTFMDKQLTEQEKFIEENKKLSQRVQELEIALKESKGQKNKAHTHRLSARFMVNPETRFIEGILRFLEGKGADTHMYEDYQQWHQDVTKKLVGNCVYQCAEYIFVKLHTDKDKRQNRELTFSSKGENLKFESGCTAKELRDEGWPDDVDHIYILHPENQGECKMIPKLTKCDDEGKGYFIWTIRIPSKYYRKEEQTENQDEHFSVIVCAFKSKE